MYDIYHTFFFTFFNNSMKKFKHLIEESNFRDLEVQLVYKTTNKLNIVIKKRET